MSKQAVNAFLVRIETDATFREELCQAVAGESPSPMLVVDFARHRGFDFSEPELRETLTTKSTGRELSDTEAAAVSGGLGAAVDTFRRLSLVRFGTDVWTGGARSGS